MANKSKIKGSSGERELCQILGGIFNDKFIRVPNSGAMVGGLNAARKAAMNLGQIKLFKGDLICPDSLPKMVIESKSYRSFPWHQLIRNDQVKMLEGKDGWIQQTLDATDPGDIWFLCMKFNNVGWFVLFNPKLLTEKSKLKGLQAEYKMPNMIIWKDYFVADLVDFFTTYATELKTLCS